MKYDSVPPARERSNKLKDHYAANYRADPKRSPREQSQDNSQPINQSRFERCFPLIRIFFLTPKELVF
jgi:hypothetical protein